MEWQEMAMKDLRINRNLRKNLDVNVPQKDNVPVYKYMTISTALKCLGIDGERLKTTLRFTQPSEWNDPAEKAFYEATLKRGKETLNFYAYACCVSKQQQSEAAWMTYEYGKHEGCVKFSIDKEKLYQEIENWAANNGFTFYYDEAIYSDWGKLKELAEKIWNTEEVQKGSNILDVEKFLCMLLLKRNAYKYEDEIRLFLIKGDGKTQKIDDEGKPTKILDIAINLPDCINAIYIGKTCGYKMVEQLKNSQYKDKVHDSTWDNDKVPVSITINKNKQ